jgi:hypothetical protein
MVPSFDVGTTSRKSSPETFPCFCEWGKNYLEVAENPARDGRTPTSSIAYYPIGSDWGTVRISVGS